MGREEVGSSSNQPELAAFFPVLSDTLIEEPMLYLCDNQSSLKAVNRWIGEGGKAILVGASSTWTADFTLLHNEGTAFWGMYFHDLRVPWRHKRRKMIAEIIVVAKWLAKIKRRLHVGCRLCKRAREQRGASTENLPDVHINSAFYDGIATTVTAAHHFIWRHCMLAYKLHKYQRVSSGLSHLIKRVVSTRCGRKMSFEQICSR